MEHEPPTARLPPAPAEDGDARLRLVIEEAGLATWDRDLSTDQAIWSPNMFRLLGYPIHPAGHATKEMWASRLHPDDRERVLAELDRARRERSLYRCEHRIVRADSGEVLWIEPHARFLYDASGAATRIVGVSADITARKQPRSGSSGARRSSISRPASSASACSIRTTSRIGSTGPIGSGRSTRCRPTSRRTSRCSTRR